MDTVQRSATTGDNRDANHRLLNTIPDAVDRTRMSRAHLYREMERGRLRFVHAGARRLIPEEALTDYVRLLEAEAAASAGEPETKAS